jgi:hypothetical protein
MTIEQLQLLQELKQKTGECFGCGHRYEQEELPAGWGMLIEAKGVVIFTLCASCEPQIPDPGFRRSLNNVVYAAMFGAGLLRVKGSA